MSQVQILVIDGKRFALLPEDVWERVRGAVEEAEDVADLERFDRTDDGVRIPGAVAFAIADGVHPVRAWREHRGLSQERLAEAASLSKAYVSQIESGKRTGSARTLRAVAKALTVTLDALLTEQSPAAKRKNAG